MSQTIDTRVSRFLDHGENLLWSGKSKRSFVFHPASVLLIVCMLLVFGLVVGLVALNNMKHSILIIEIITEAARQRFTTVGIFSGLGILLGLIALWGFVFYPLRRRKTIYAVTDKRAMIISGFWYQKAESHAIDEINFTAMTRPAKDRATVVFGRYPTEYAEMDGAQRRRVMSTWKWFGYIFQNFEIGQPRTSWSGELRRPVFGRFEHVENPERVYEILKRAAGIKTPAQATPAEVKWPSVGTLANRVVATPGVITFALDVSGSMDGYKLDMAKKGALASLEMSEDNRVGLIAFDTDIVGRVEVAPLSENRDKLRSAILRMQAGSSTALYDALKEAIEMTDRADSRAEGRRAVVVLTDGQANAGKTRLDDIVWLENSEGQRLRATWFSDDGITDPGGNKVDAVNVRGIGLALITSHPVQIYYVGIGSDADMEIGRILAGATGAESEVGIGLPSGDVVERVRRVKEVDIARVLEEFKYF